MNWLEVANKRPVRQRVLVIVNAWFFRVLSDLSVKAFGGVSKNSARGRRPSALFLVTRPEASTDKSDNTRKNHALIALI